MADLQDIQELEDQAAADQGTNSSSPSSAPDSSAAPVSQPLTEEEQAEKDKLLDAAETTTNGPAALLNHSEEFDVIPDSSQGEHADISNMVASADPEDIGIHQESGANNGEFPDAHPVPGAPVRPAANPAMAQAIDSAIQNPQVKQYLMEKYGFGPDLNDAALKAAQDKALSLAKQNQIGRALDTAGYGFAQLGAGADWNKIKDDTGILDNEDKLAQQPVNNLLARRTGIVQNEQLSTDQAKNQSLQDSLKNQLALSDPDSPESVAARKAYLPILQKAGLDVNNLNGASANTIKTVLQQPLEFADKQKQADLVHQDAKDLKILQVEAMNRQREFENGFKIQNFNDKQLQQSQVALNKDPQVIQASKSNDAITSALDTLELAKTNPIAFKANALDLAKSVLAGAGKLNQTEINQFAGGSAAFNDRLAQIYDQAASGTISDANYQFSKQLLQHLKQKNDQVVQGRQQVIAGQLTRRNNGDMNQNLNNITGRQVVQPSNSEQPASVSSQQPSQLAPQGKVKVSNGTKSFFIDPSNLADAQKDGYNQVQ